MDGDEDSVAAALSPMKDQLQLGLELYPLAGCDMPSGSDIDVEVQAGGKALPIVTKELATVDPSGGTPTAAALARALDYYTRAQAASSTAGSTCCSRPTAVRTATMR